MRKGYLNVRVDGELREIVSGMKLDRYKNHDIEVVVDKMMVKANCDEERLKKSVATAMKAGAGLMMIMDKDNDDIKFFSKNLIKS